MKPALLVPFLLLIVGALLFLALQPLAWQWPTLLWLLALLWVLGRGGQLPLAGLSPITRFVITIFLLFLANFTAGWGNWLQMGAASLYVLFAVKILELRGIRDLFQIAALLLLGMGLAAWIQVDLSLGIYFLLELFLLLLALLWQGYLDARAAEERAPEFRDYLRLAGFAFGFVLLLLPIMGGLFLLLPRTPTPLWHWGGSVGTAVSGFSASLNPSQIQSLQNDPAVAFRAQIQGPHLASAQMYWVGAVLWQDAGGVHWQPGTPPLHCTPQESPLWEQHILLSPGRHSYLFALTTPLRVQSSLPVQNASGWRLQQEDDQAYRYTAWSGAQDTCFSAAARAAALQLPPEVDPQIRALADSLRGTDHAATVQRILAWLRGPSFRYSLQTPPAYPHGQSLADFLLHSHTGFCEYYAAGLATLLRLDGVPARVVVGYHGGQYDSLGDFWVVRQNMAHAWVQAWLHGRWVLLDATPGTAEGQSSADASSAVASLSAGSQIWSWLQWEWLNWVINFSPSKQRSVWMAAGSLLQPQHSSNPSREVDRPGKVPARALLYLALLALLLLLWWRLRRGVLVPEDAATRFRRRAIGLLRRAGLEDLRPGRERPWLQQLPLAAEARAELQQALWQQRYGPRPDAAGEAQLRRHLPRRWWQRFFRVRGG